MNAMAAAKNWLASLVATTEQQERTTTGTMPDDTQEIRDRFFLREDSQNKKLSPIQDRMQSGDN